MQMSKVKTARRSHYRTNNHSYNRLGGCEKNCKLTTLLKKTDANSMFTLIIHNKNVF